MDLQQQRLGDYRWFPYRIVVVWWPENYIARQDPAD